MTAAAKVPGHFDAVAAVPTRNGHVDASLVPWVRHTGLGPDGRVELALERRFDWVLLLLNTEAPLRQRVVGYVTYSSTAGRGGRRVRLQLSRSTLRELARQDDGYRNVVNLYLNRDAESGRWLTARPRQVWLAPDPQATVNRRPAPEDYRFAGFGVDLALVGHGVAPRAGCEDTMGVGLYPPAPATAASGARFGPARPLPLGGCAGAERGVRYWHFPGTEPGALLEQLPDGWWTLLRSNTGEVLAELEVAADPPVTPSGHTLVFVPLPRLILSADGRRVSHVAIDWVRYDSSRGRYVPAQPVVMSKLLNDSFVALEADGDAESLTARVDRHAPQPIRAVGDQRLGAERAVPGPGKEGGVIAVTVGYEMQGVAYRFSWRAPK